MLKKEKKLHNKIDTLTRKVQNLQNKLTAATTLKSNPISEPVISVLKEPSTSPNVAIPSASTRPTISVSPRPSLQNHDTLIPITRAPFNRAVSGPSSLPVPKTPERKPRGPSVFETRTENRQIANHTMSDTQASSSASGKKRKVPDDYDESLPPPQGFTAECLPIDDAVNTTPQLRRARHSGSGFTPVRGHPTVPSPKREVIAKLPIYISDVTNSPRRKQPVINQPTKPTKRTWLGKIKGVSLQASSLTASSHVFERVSGGVS